MAIYFFGNIMGCYYIFTCSKENVWMKFGFWLMLEKFNLLKQKNLTSLDSLFGPHFLFL